MPDRGFWCHQEVEKKDPSGAKVAKSATKEWKLKCAFEVYAS